MSIFGSIMSKIFGSGSAEAAPGSAAPSGSAAPAPSSPAPSDTTSSSTAAPSAPASGGAAPSTAPASVDVAAVLDGMDTGGQKLDWRHSIVDLMKLLHIDSSLTARKELAHELHYTGDTEDSATMNMWLHKQVMQKLAENGGKLPPDIH
ncbi:hypothetical protein RHAL1_03303 [Beijerinckiaceae bacterium RH AL1]|nr:hypothetical protein RHCH11_RHCH11_03237 [Beijerinckiaceae bacterium RH CH11]VVB48482.1 hypothetical protein RHAL8_03233 [Beijerinckiaceae bacterium RH AL8]VVC56376.1 hypothetical protein RHAL1_03303 [Beijerinckiaceae bacterium RH AL1]